MEFKYLEEPTDCFFCHGNSYLENFHDLLYIHYSGNVLRDGNQWFCSIHNVTLSVTHIRDKWSHLIGFFIFMVS